MLGGKYTLLDIFFEVGFAVANDVLGAFDPLVYSFAEFQRQTGRCDKL